MAGDDNKMRIASLIESARCLGVAQAKGDTGAIAHWSAEVETYRLTAAEAQGDYVRVPEAMPITKDGLTGGVACAGDWAIERAPGCVRIVDERFARGWNACRDSMLTAAGAQEKGNG